VKIKDGKVLHHSKSRKNGGKNDDKPSFSSAYELVKHLKADKLKNEIKR